MNAFNITKHSIDRTALIAGIMFTFAGLAYLVDDHGLINVTEGAVAGTIVIVIGLVLLLAAVIDSPEVPLTTTDDFTRSSGSAMSTTDQADFSWSNPVGPAPIASQAGFDEVADGHDTDTEHLTDQIQEIPGIDEAE